MVNVAQLVRASDCGPEGRGFKPHLSPRRVAGNSGNSFFILACPIYRLGITQPYNNREFFYLFLSFIKEIFCDDMFCRRQPLYLSQKAKSWQKKIKYEGWESSSTNCGMSIIYLHPISLSM